MWNLEQAVELARKVEERIHPLFHCGITGSCLYKGSSDKDIDFIIYPHNKKLTSINNHLTDLINWLDTIELKVVSNRGAVHSRYGDTKAVFQFDLVGRRVDIFFLE